MKRYSTRLTYTESDGFEIQHKGNNYWIRGFCDGEYICYFNPDANIVCIEFNAWINSICDGEGEEADIILTDDESEIFKQYMASRLDEVAKNYNFRKDYMGD